MVIDGWQVDGLDAIIEQQRRHIDKLEGRNGLLPATLNPRRLTPLCTPGLACLSRPTTRRVGVCTLVARAEQR